METTSVEPVARPVFSDVTSVRPTAPGRFVAAVDPGWTIDGKPNGGYLLAMLGRAATSETPHDHVVAASVHFLRPPSPGQVVIDVEVLRAGRTASQSRVRMTQGGVGCAEALVTSGSIESSSRPRWSRELPDEMSGTPVPIEDCVRLTAPLPDGRDVAIIRQVEIRLEPDTIGFTRGRPSGRGELRGWLRLPGDEHFDPTSLLYAVDSFPAATFDVEYSGWVPSIELTAYVRAMPVPGPVRIAQRAQLVDAGRVDEVCFVWDVSGRLVAQATQLAGIRFS